MEKPMFKRIGLFLATNLAVLVTFGVVLSILQSTGIAIPGSYSLLLFALFFGFGGAFISLFLSKPIAKWTTGARVIETPNNIAEKWLVERVKLHAENSGIKNPEVAIYPANDINAFATGWNRNNALVAVSSGLLTSLNSDEADAVLAHEVSHIANGDMITMTLIQGVLNTFVIMAARIVGGVIDKWISGGESGRGFGYFAVVITLEIIFGLLASLITCAFSRYREYRADEGGARLTSPQHMMSALKKIANKQEESALPDAIKAFGIGNKKSVLNLYQTHPPIEKRIEALSKMMVI
jgi:heat shock protein HtpX